MKEKKTQQRVKGKGILIYLDPELWRECKHVGIDRGCPASRVVEEAVRAHLHALKGGA